MGTGSQETLFHTTARIAMQTHRLEPNPGTLPDDLLKTYVGKV